MKKLIYNITVLSVTYFIQFELFFLDYRFIDHLKAELQKWYVRFRNFFIR